MAEKINLRSHRKHIKRVNYSKFDLGNDSPLFLLAGPCIIEDLSICK